MKNYFKLFLGVILLGIMSCEIQEEIRPTSNTINANSSAIDEFLVADGCANCELGTAIQDGSNFPWGMLLYDNPNHTDPGATRTPYLLDNDMGNITLCSDGTAILTGSVHGQWDASLTWSFEVFLSDGLPFDEWQTMGGNYTAGGLDVTDLVADWMFYIIDPNQTSTLTGTGSNAGTNYTITHKPVDYSKRIQIGYGANNRNFNLGLIGWFGYVDANGGDVLQGDFIFDINCPPPPADGCTHTIGYWKTHNGTKKQADVVSQYLPISLGSLEVVDVATSVDVFKMKTYGSPSNGITKLYAQLLGTKLSIADGADSSPVADAITDADAFLNTYDHTDWDSLSDTQQTMVLDWKTTFDDYNNGATSVAHCN